MSNNDRFYNLTDAALLQFGRNVKGTLPQDMAEFKKFDSSLQDNYPESINIAIQKITEIKTDNVVIDEMTEKTQAVNDALAACNTAYRTIYFFVTKAFPNNRAVQNQFGANDIAKYRRNQAGMLVFMADFIKMVTKYRETIIGEGCSETVVDSLGGLRARLETTKTDQEMFKKERGLITQERIDKLNELYNLLKPISEIAQIIYADDEARLKRYSIPSPKSSTNSEQDLIVS